MTQPLVFANARLILETEVVTGSLVAEGGVITEITQGEGGGAGAIDCGGDFVAPGLIELHTDNLERHISPRPAVDWPHDAAILAHDAELAGCGITTVFDAIRVGSILTTGKVGYKRYARRMADEILGMRAAGHLRISHHLHLRAEICSETLEDELAEFGEADRVGIVSLMDHTPGQRQFTDISKFEAYMRGKHGLTSAGFDAYVQHLYGLQEKLGAKHEAAAVEAARRYGAALASHDDSTEAQVAQSVGYGVQMAEFPTTLEAAQACEAAGIAVIMGAPNLIRGGSHSGNVSAQSLAEADCLDILSSDYVPAALLTGAVQLGRLWDDMPKGMATVTAAPARATGLADRGRIAVGQRADLIRFGIAGEMPRPSGTWVQGTRVA